MADAMKTRPTYTARAHREGPWWVAEVEEQGIATQAKRLDLLDGVVRDLLVAWLQVPADSFDVVIEPEVPKAAAGSVKRARKLRGDVDRLQGEAAEATREAATALVGSGLTVRDAGALLGLSYQRVGQLVGHR
jgi:hypothetical protein